MDTLAPRKESRFPIDLFNGKNHNRPAYPDEDGRPDRRDDGDVARDNRH